MSEETLKKESPIMTLAAKILMALSPVPIPREVASFYIDNPAAMKRRAEAFASLPLIVQVIAVRGSPCCGLATLIDAWWGERFDVVASDTLLEEGGHNFVIHERTNIVIVDSLRLYRRVSEILVAQKRNKSVTILFVLANLTGVIRHEGTCDNTLFFCDAKEASRWIAIQQKLKLVGPLDERMKEFDTDRR